MIYTSCNFVQYHFVLPRLFFLLLLSVQSFENAISCNFSTMIFIELSSKYYNMQFFFLFHMRILNIHYKCEYNVI